MIRTVDVLLLHSGAIFGINSAGQYGIELDANGHPIGNYKDDELSRLKAEYLAGGNQRDNLFWGWIRNQEVE